MFLARFKLGRAFRATSDDREAAELMGINNKHIYSLAMAIALAIVAVAGVLLAIRTTFDPTQGSFRLIYAFEAVIMGGMGSMWGTLLGGIVLGVSRHRHPGVRRRLGSCGRPPGLPHGPRRPARAASSRRR